ncbi:hypothetical protein Bbelb_156790 [Branchiostoma belcheri]|nr:hypothetical protein Bbelb_156790 [Branchiostoma belcheri]
MTRKVSVPFPADIACTAGPPVQLCGRRENKTVSRQEADASFFKALVWHAMEASSFRYWSATTWSCIFLIAAGFLTVVEIYSPLSDSILSSQQSTGSRTFV